MNPYVKGLLFLLFFVALHHGYELTGWYILTPICGINESVFQHLKMAYWSYLFVSLAEYLAARRTGKRDGHWYPRLLAAVVVPWIAMLVWYLMPALAGRVESLALHVAWAILATYVTGVAGAFIERGLKESPPLELKALILALSVISAFLYTWFTYNPPYIDVFVDPETLKG
jgi:surface polysaccharide O-acyltransferase-like enzyme